MGKQVKFDFFQPVSLNDPQLPLRQALLTIMRLPANDSRNAPTSNGQVRAQQLTSRGDFFEGEMIRIRMDEVPIKASLDGDVEPFELDDDEGIGEETAFLYCVSRNVLVLQRNRYGVSASTLGRYFEDRGGAGPFILRPILLPEVMREFANMRRLTKFEIGIAHPSVAASLRGRDPGVGAVLSLGERLSSASVKVSFSVGHTRSSLAAREVSNIVHMLTGYARTAGGENLQRLEVSGRNGDGAEVMLDLLEWKMVDVEGIDLDSERRLPYAQRLAALRAVWNRKDRQLAELLS